MKMVRIPAFPVVMIADFFVGTVNLWVADTVNDFDVSSIP